MSELKTYKMVDEKYCTDCVCVIPSEVYSKSEADKVIAELKKEIEHLDAHLAGFLELEEEHGGGDLRKYINKIRRDNNELFTSNWSLKGTNKVLDELLKEKQRECRHHKYKRCLAMARWCKDKVDAIQNGYMRSSIESQNGVMTTCPPKCNPKFSFYSKWRRSWLELAEKFKEN